MNPMNWNDKPYRSLDWMLKERFHRKVCRLSLNAGMTCPNRDGTAGTGGCIFCSAGGSGEFAGSPALPITAQAEAQRKVQQARQKVDTFIAYFQAYTNTYAPVERLEALFTEAIRLPDIAVLSIATRPDALPPEVVALLARLNRIKPVWVELGLQTIHEETAAFIRRGYPLSCFDEAVRSLRESGIEVIVHTILGLPGETPEQMLATMRALSERDVQGIKIQMLQILEGTDLASLYRENPWPVMSRDDYIALVCSCLEVLRSDITVHRLTGDGPKDLLIAPAWTKDKRAVLNGLHRYMREKGTWQGRLCT